MCQKCDIFKGVVHICWRKSDKMLLLSNIVFVYLPKNLGYVPGASIIYQWGFCVTNKVGKTRCWREVNLSIS